MQDAPDVKRFEAAVDAVVAGDLAALNALVRADPALVRARSAREHHATLLHYTGSNGVEDERQRTPPNVVPVVAFLIGAGAEIDATADMYGGGATTLGLAASSVHPLRAGLHRALINALIDFGAAPDGLPSGWAPIVAALGNGRLSAAETLAARGARVDNLAVAAALGRLDLVRRFVGGVGLGDTPMRGIPTEAQARTDLAFGWACAYGRTPVVELLLDRGHDPASQDDMGQTGLHHAAHGGQIEVVDLLLARGAPLEIVNAYGGTPLGQAVWSAVNGSLPVDHTPIVERLLGAGARHDGIGLPTGHARIDEVLRRLG